jgi:hypothetical protein
MSTGGSAQFGFQWTDVSTPNPASVRPTSIQISFQTYAQCGPTTTLQMKLNGHLLNETYSPDPLSANCTATCPGAGGSGSAITLNDANDLTFYNPNNTNTLVILDPYTDPEAGALTVMEGYLPVTGSEYATIVVTFP